MNWGSLFVVSGLPVLLGLFILSRLVVHMRKASQRGDWPSVTGEILASDIKKVTNYVEGASTDYFPVVRYRYKVNLVEYESGAISASEAPFAIGTENYARSQVQKYQVHTPVKVFYNPENPAEAVLDNSGASSSGMLLFLCLGLGLLACGLMPWLYFILDRLLSG